MAERPWLTIIGLGEDGPDGLPPASLAALKSAKIVMGPPRHMSLLPALDAQLIEWPVPFSDGVTQLMGLRGQDVVVLASGDPFWFGAGSVLARQLEPDEWRALPGPSCFALAANHLGWPLEHTPCIALHAAPLTRLRPHLRAGGQMIVTLRDGAGPAALAAYLVSQGYGLSRLHVMQALGGPRQKISTHVATAATDDLNFVHPLCVAIDLDNAGTSLPLASGRPDDWFDHDGQITKRPVRALTLSALAPCPGEHLWDIGGGSGSIAIEWLLAHPTTQATCVEIDPTRAERITQNAARLGVDRLRVVIGAAPEALAGLDCPDAVFVGGGLSVQMLVSLSDLAKGARLVANAVTLETEALLAHAHAEHGGALHRIEMAQSKPLGSRRGWKSAYPIVQWSVTL